MCWELLHWIDIQVDEWMIEWASLRRYFLHNTSSSKSHCYLTPSFPGGSDDKESTCKVGDPGSIPGLERSPGGGHGNPLQYSCLDNPHGLRCLASYSPWGHKESVSTERLITAQLTPVNDLDHFYSVFI